MSQCEESEYVLINHGEKIVDNRSFIFQTHFNKKHCSVPIVVDVNTPTVIELLLNHCYQVFKVPNESRIRMHWGSGAKEVLLELLFIHYGYLNDLTSLMVFISLLGS